MLTDGVTTGRVKLGVWLVAEDRDRPYSGSDPTENPLHEDTRIRVPLLLFRLKEGATPGTGMYRSWNNVSWILEVPTAAEAILLRDTLQLFFSTIASEGIAATHGYLTGPIEPA